MKRPRFSLRTLFVLVAIAGVPMAWGAYQLNWIRQRHEFISHFRAVSGYSPTTVDPQAAPWPLSLFGENGYTCMLHFPESQLKRAQALFPETKFYPYSDQPAK
jgi:hypothetical protein